MENKQLPINASYSGEGVFADIDNVNIEERVVNLFFYERIIAFNLRMLLGEQLRS